MTSIITAFIIISLLGIFTFLAAWKENAVPFMLLAGLSMMAGLYIPDVAGETNGVTIAAGLVLIGYSLLCCGWAIRLMFWKEDIS